MKVSDEISTLRNMLKEVTDDSKYSNSFLFSILTRSRAKIASAINLSSNWNKHRFCLELEKVTSHNCDCISVGCLVLRTKYPVPRPLIGKYTSVMEVMDLSGNLIGETTETALKSEKHDPVKANKIRYTVYNDYIYIWNVLTRKVIQVNAVWNNILEFDGIEYCLNEAECTDFFNLEMGLSLKESELMLRNSMDLLGFPLKLVDDQSSDRNPERRAS